MTISATIPVTTLFSLLDVKEAELTEPQKKYDKWYRTLRLLNSNNKVIEIKFFHPEGMPVTGIKQ